MMLKDTDQSTFQEDVINEKLPVLVDFWAEWCGPCKMIAPTLQEISKDYEGKVKIVKVNIDENTDLAMRYAIRSIPTMLLFKDGAVKGQILGAVAKTKITELIDQNLS